MSWRKIGSTFLVAMTLVITLSGCLAPVGSGRSYRGGRYGRSGHYRVDPVASIAAITFGAALLAILNTGRSEAPPEEGYSISPECEEYLDTERYPGYDVERLVYSCEQALADRRVDELNRRRTEQRRLEREVYRGIRGR